ncbi:c-type cytochrome [Caenibius tardaugens]|nr:cytochrome c [Caenibius tardaugens]AZI36276.1 cytochrome c [Caenibius tardaugens NBRC 16725]
MTDDRSTMGFGARVAMVFALLGGAAALSAATLSAADAVAARKANFKEIGGAFKAINDELKAGAPDVAKLRPPARTIVQRSHRIKDHFPAGSGPDSGLKTKARPEIWSNQVEFGKYRQAMVISAGAFDKAVRSGDLAAITKARDALGTSCQGCHNQFREK